MTKRECLLVRTVIPFETGHFPKAHPLPHIIGMTILKHKLGRIQIQATAYKETLNIVIYTFLLYSKHA